METSKDFFNDVIFMKNLVGKTVRIKTLDNCIYEGVVYVIDPTYKTTVLVVPNNQNSTESHLEFILSDSILSYQVDSGAASFEFLSGQGIIKNEACDGNELINKKKDALVKWLRQMFINVEVHEACLKVEEHVEIGPPYERNNCICSNTIVLERIRGIIDLMPNDFE